ncbi:hypothetical protein Peur_029479 [Populus x canadensis]
MDSFKTGYSGVYREMRAQTYALESTKQRLVEAYNYIDLLEKGMANLEKKLAKLKGARDTLKEEPKIAREDVQNSRARMENLKNSSQALWSEYRESVSLMKTLGDKIFLAMSNLYFFSLSRGIQVDFSKSFSDFQVLDCADVFSIKVALAKSGVYLAQELGLEIPLRLFFIIIITMY